MTREEIMVLDLEQLEERAGQIAIETEEASAEALEGLNEELNAIEERKAALKLEIETRKKEIAEVAQGAGEVIEKSEERTKKMTDIEIRKSPEYLDAWVEFQKGRASEEQRALLTQNAPSGGKIAVPVYVEDRIHTAWESNEIVRRIRRSYFKGNLKVGVEMSADPAQLHAEGGNAITEENLDIITIDLIPIMIKKMVRYSDEVLDMRGQAFVDYIFDEIEYQIVGAVAKTAVQMMVFNPDGLTPVQAMAGASLTTADIINAQGQLGGEATNPVLITTRANAAALKAAALSAQYGYDPFDGLEVLYVDSSALTFTQDSETWTATAVIADLSGVLANFPDGDVVKFKFDDLTEAPSDMIRVIGRLYAAIRVVDPGKTVSIQTA